MTTVQTNTETTKSNGKALASTIVDIAIGHVHESKVNPRKVFRGIEELAADVGALGILEPLLVRPISGAGGNFEIVFGARRYRAAKIAKLATIPCLVRELSDLEAYERMVAENNHRDDLHPLEEAESYEHFHKVHGLSVDDIAAKVGQNRAHVYARMKLLALCPDARKAFYDGKITPSVALYVARIPHEKLQRDALKEIIEGTYEKDEPMGARRAFSIIEHRFMLRLVDAPFDKKDETLVPAAGSCSDCPNRTGNQKELFADVKSADVCTDPSCFADKRKAHTKKVLAAASEKGQTILEGKKAEAALMYGSPFVRLDEQDHTEKGKGRTYRAQLKGADLETTLAVDSRGDVRELVKRADAAKVVKHLGEKKGASMSEDEKKGRENAKKKKVVTREVLAAIVAKAEKAEPTKAFWGMLCRLLALLAHNDAVVGVLQRRDVIEKRKMGADNRQSLRAYIEKLPPDEARGLAVELAASFGAFDFSPYNMDPLGKGLQIAASYYSVDVAKARAKALEALKAKKATKKGAAKS